MYNKIHLFSVLIFSLSMLNCQTNTKSEEPKITYNVSKTDKEWREELSPEEYDILRNKGTERPHTGIYNMHFEDEYMFAKDVDNRYSRVITNLCLIVDGQVMKVLYLAQ